MTSPLAEFYSEIRIVHITAVLANGSLFLARGLVLFSGAQWAMAAPVRYLSYTVDTVLLTAALMLMGIIQQYPLVNAWLTVKITLVLLYIALGIIAFRKGRTSRRAVGFWLAALVTYALIFSVARTHDPLGFLGTLAKTG